MTGIRAFSAHLPLTSLLLLLLLQYYCCCCGPLLLFGSWSINININTNTLRLTLVFWLFWIKLKTSAWLPPPILLKPLYYILYYTKLNTVTQTLCYITSPALTILLQISTLQLLPVSMYRSTPMTNSRFPSSTPIRS